MRELSPAERLIVAADFKPEVGTNGVTTLSVKEAIEKVKSLARDLSGTGVYIKVNSALRAAGYDLISFVRSYGLKVFADLKLVDISETLSTDGAFLQLHKPDLLTVKCVAGPDGMRSLMQALPATEILGVTVLTNLGAVECQAIYGCGVQEAVLRLAKMAEDAPIHGLVCSAAEVSMLREHLKLPMSLNTPAIRPSWSIVEGDDQNPVRVMTPEKAILAGATRLVIGRPIVQAADRLGAVKKTLEEIEQALEKVPVAA